LDIQLYTSGALVGMHCGDNTVKTSLVRDESPNYEYSRRKMEQDGEESGQ
jgi:hypothetical protein